MASRQNGEEIAAGGFDGAGVGGQRSTSALKQGMDTDYAAVERAIRGNEHPSGRSFPPAPAFTKYYCIRLEALGGDRQ